MERAFDALKAYYKNVDLHRDFDGIQPLPYKNVFCSGVVGFLNERSKGRRILVFRAGNWDPSQISFLDIRICVFYHLQYASDDSDTQELGIIFIMDLAGISFAHIRDISFRDVRRSVNAMQVSYAFIELESDKKNFCILFSVILTYKFHSITYLFVTFRTVCQLNSAKFTASTHQLFSGLFLLLHVQF